MGGCLLRCGRDGGWDRDVGLASLLLLLLLVSHRPGLSDFGSERRKL